MYRKFATMMRPLAAYYHTTVIAIANYHLYYIYIYLTLLLFCISFVAWIVRSAQGDSHITWTLPQIIWSPVPMAPSPGGHCWTLRRVFLRLYNFLSTLTPPAFTCKRGYNVDPFRAQVLSLSRACSWAWVHCRNPTNWPPLCARRLPELE